MGMSEGVRARLQPNDGGDPRYWPIASYGVIGDCRTAALIAPNGSIDWVCLPHFDSPASLLRLLDHDRGGYLHVRPAHECESLMRYLPGTNILETTFTSAQGAMSLTDFMPIRKRQPHARVLSALAALSPTAPHGARAPLEQEIGNDVATAHRINRLVTCQSGTVTLRVSLKVTPNFARHVPQMTTQHAGTGAFALISDDHRSGHLVLVIRPLADAAAARQASALAVSGPRDGAVSVSVSLSAGQRMAVALAYARTADEARTTARSLMTQDFDADLRETQRYWTDWSSKLAYDGTYRDIAMRSALALKLCVFEPTGAIIAAPTTSLPEEIHGIRNWDYRYSWLRDSSLSLNALARLGFAGEARDYFHFLHDLHLRDGADIHVLYSMRGATGADLHEEELPHLEGYMGSRPVRTGNGAATQRQMDIYGELADAALRYVNAAGFAPTQATRRVPRDMRYLMTQLANYVVDHWRDLDRGIWEERGPERAFVYSRVMCWVALDRAIKVVSHYTNDGLIARWRATAQTIREDVESQGYSETFGAFIQAYGVQAADASNLRIPLVGFLPPHDPRIQSTIRVTGEKLSSQGPLLYRYLVNAERQRKPPQEPTTNDGLQGGEGAFLACAFWYVSCLCLVDRVEEARERLDALLAYASPLGLYAEEVDPQTGALLGNFPQAFTHLGLVNALAWHREAERRAQRPASVE